MELFVPKPLVYKAKRQTPATEHQKERLIAVAAAEKGVQL